MIASKKGQELKKEGDKWCGDSRSRIGIAAC